MDWGSVAGLVLALAGVLLGQVLEGGRLGALMQPAAFLIVFVGTFGAVLLQSGLTHFMHGVKLVRRVFVDDSDDYRVVMRAITAWSTTARREGLLSLERYIDSIEDSFIAEGLHLIVDGVDPVKLRELLDLEISAYETRERLAVRVWESAGGYAPTIGIIGAVLGLIHVMENLTDPARLGAGIAVAFVATIYGVGMANLIFLPIGSRLKMIVNREVLRREMLADAFAGIVNGDNPRLIEQRMAVFLR